MSKQTKSIDLKEEVIVNHSVSDKDLQIKTEDLQKPVLSDSESVLSKRALTQLLRQRVKFLVTKVPTDSKGIYVKEGMTYTTSKTMIEVLSKMGVEFKQA